MANKNNKRDLTQGAVWRKLMQLGLPMVFGIMAVISVSLVDTYFVGELGTKPLAALSFTFPVTLTLTSLAIGLGAGASSVVSRAIGSGDNHEAKRLSTDALILAVGMVSILTVAGLLVIRPVFALLGAEGEILDLIVRYMRIWFLSLPFVVVPMVANSIIRAAGDALWPSLIMIGSAIINAMLTPVFIQGWGPVPAMDIEGAALATLIARAGSLALGLYLVAMREKMIIWKPPPMSEMLASWRRVLVIGLPASAGNAVNPVGITIVTAIIAGIGAETVAAFGVATRIESFAAIPMLALSSAIGPFTGQNWGAEKKDRVLQALKVSFGFCFAWALFLAAVFWLFGQPIAALFASDGSVAEEATLYLHIVPISLWGFGVTISAAGAFNALGKPVTGLGFYLTRTAVFYVPLSYLALLFGQSEAVFIAIAVSNALAGIVVGGWSLWWLSRAEIGDCSVEGAQPVAG